MIKTLIVVATLAACGSAKEPAATSEACRTARQTTAAAWDAIGKQIDDHDKQAAHARLGQEALLKAMSGGDPAAPNTAIAKQALDALYADAEGAVAAKQAAREAAAAWRDSGDAANAEQAAVGKLAAYGESMQKSIATRVALADALVAEIRTYEGKIAPDDPKRKQIEGLLAEQRAATDEMTKALLGDRTASEQKITALRADFAKRESDDAAALRACQR